jgi:hypothetical protein
MGNKQPKDQILSEIPPNLKQFTMPKLANAILEQNTEKLKKQITKFDINEGIGDHSKCTPLLLAVHLQNFEIVKFLLDQGAIVEQTYWKRLIISQAHRSVSVAALRFQSDEILCEIGKHLQEFELHNILVMLCRETYPNFIRIKKIIDILPDIDGKSIGKGGVLFGLTVGAPNLELVKYIISEKKANVNSVDHYNRTALMLLCEEGERNQLSLDIAQVLLENGTDLSVKTEGCAYDYTAFEFAKVYKWKEMVSLIENYLK